MKKILTAIILLNVLVLCSCGFGESAETHDTSGVYTELRSETADPGIVSENTMELSEPSTVPDEDYDHSTDGNSPDLEPTPETSDKETRYEIPEKIITAESQSETLDLFESETVPQSIPETIVDFETGKDGEIELPIDVIE